MRNFKAKKSNQERATKLVATWDKCEQTFSNVKMKLTQNYFASDSLQKTQLLWLHIGLFGCFGCSLVALWLLAKYLIINMLYNMQL